MKINQKKYKDLNKPIASSYIYRRYDLVDNQFFETLDIINCAFIIADEKANLNGDIFLENVQKYILPQAQKFGCYVIFSIAPESKWEIIAQSSDLIKKLAENIVMLINNYGFDGVDLDWEYPKEGQYQWFTALAKEVNQKVKANNCHHLVTAAITGGKWQPRYYDLLNSGKYLDYINVMTYSLSSNQGFYQSALFPSENFNQSSYLVGKTNETCSIVESAEIFWKEYQLPYHRLIMGIPFYGVKQIRNYDEKTKSWSTWKSPGTIFYTNIKNDYLKNRDYLYFFDDISKVPFLVKKDGTEFIAFENSNSITYKCQYVLENKLAGLMFWEYGCDMSGELLNALKNGLYK